MACPGSVQLAAQFPTPPTSSHAQEGTAAHALAELSLRRGADPETFIGTTLEGVEVDEHMADAVRVYVEHCRALQAKATWHRVEQRFNLAALNPPGPMFGTADHVAYDGFTQTLYVSDLKYGQGVLVEAVDNKQLRYYALGATLTLPRECPVTTVVMTIVQPRALHAAGPVREEIIAVEELLAFATELLDAARATTAPDAPLVAGSHCRWCPASGACPAQRDHALTVAQEEFSVIEQRNVLPAPSGLSDAQLAEIMEKLPVLEDWAAAVRAHVKAKLERGEEVPGFKLVAKRATRRWVDEAHTTAYLHASGYEDEEIFEMKLLSPAKIEKLLGKKNFPAEQTTKVSSGWNMAPAHDPRPAVDLTAGSEFLALPAGDD